MPTGTEFLDKCIDENGKLTTGLTIEGELNKARKLNKVFAFGERTHYMLQSVIYCMLSV